jgi:hypothetical protein
LFTNQIGLLYHLHKVANPVGIILTGKGFVRSRAAKEMKFLSHERGQFLGVGIQIGQ